MRPALLRREIHRRFGTAPTVAGLRALAAALLVAAAVGAAAKASSVRSADIQLVQNASPVADPVEAKMMKEADLYNRGMQSAGAGHWDQAAQAFQQAIALNAGDADSHFELARANEALKKDKDAEAEYRKTLQLKPGDAEANLDLGLLESRLGRYADALAPLKGAANLFSDSDSRGAEAWYMIGWCYDGMGKFADAIGPLQKSIALAPKSAPARSDLGYSYRNLKRYREALAAYQQALAADPNFAPAHHGLGATYYAMGNKSGAERELAFLQAHDRAWAQKLALEISR